MKLPRLLLYSLPIFAVLLAVWLLEPVIYYYFIPIKEKIAMDGSRIDTIKVIAHRGASGNAPENTLAAIEMALELKVDIIEIDVHFSADGELVVIHDESLERTTDGEGLVN
ncbi:MAG: glycerophosphodiester phosphodiesterase family protein [Cyclobacteriaceae bacterium]